VSHPRDILKGLGASPLKALSQNFLTSPHWSQKLVDGFLSLGTFEEIWEIGPGLGALTEMLHSKTSKPIRLFEIDKKLSQYLREKFPETPLHEGDFLTQNWIEWVSSPRKVAILSNLPYHLSSPMIFRMAEHKEVLSHFLFTFQKEFADRLTAQPNTKNYGALTLITELHFSLKNLGTLPAGAFYPPPTVASQAILFIPKPVHPNEETIIAVIKAAFAHRRKKLASNLKERFPQNQWENKLSQLGLSPTIRAESLNFNQFETLAYKIK